MSKVAKLSEQFANLKIGNRSESLNTLLNNIVYSTDEQIVGRWFNGKPIYRRCIYLINSWIIGGEAIINHNIPNVDEIWLYKAFWQRSDNSFQMIPNVHSNMEDWGSGIYDITSTNFKLWLGKQGGSFTCKYIDIIFDYTKTTD